MSFNNRQSIYSTTSAAPYGNMASNQPGTLTTSSLLSALHNAYLSGSVYSLDAATAVVVNSGAGRAAVRPTGVFDEELGMRVWEHARRRAEDQTIVLTYVKTSPENRSGS
jgi:chitin synthase